MPSTSSRTREKRPEPHKRTSRLPQLDIPISGGQEPQQSPSPRSELLSPSSTDRPRQRSDAGHGSTTKRRHTRNSGKQSSRNYVGSDASHRELLRVVVDQETEAEKLRKTLYATLQRLEEETQKASELERNSKESADRFRLLNDSRLAAQEEAAKANQELRLYQFQLANARKEISEAQELAAQLEKQKEEAELSATRARAKARKLHQRQLVMQAREEGRKMGFEAGLQQAQEEFEISPNSHAELVAPSMSSQSRSRRQRRIEQRERDSPRTPIEEGDEGNDERQRDDEDLYEEEDTIRTVDVLRSPNPFTARPNRHKIGIPQPIRPPDPPQKLLRAVSPAPTIPIQRYSIDIPPHDQIIAERNQPTDGWVTANKYREINNVAPTPPTTIRPLSVPHRASVAPPAQQQQGTEKPPAPYFIIPPPQGPPQPQPIFPPASQRTPPKSATSTKKLRFPSLAKTKAQAASWYRSFSLRRKSKPIIDPDTEDYGEVPGQQNGNGNANASAVRPPSESGTADTVYKYQPEPPTSWYSKPANQAKSQKSRHSRAVSAFDGGDHLSRASTHLSEMEMLSNAPVGRFHGGEGSVSGRSARENSRQLAQKLSVIKEDPLSRGNTPLTDKQGTKISAMGQYLAASPLAPHQLLPPSGHSEAGSARRRPPELIVKNPNGLDHLAVQNGTPAGLSTRSGGSINIAVQPATAAPEPSARVPQPMADTHLTPNYVYHKPLQYPLGSIRRDGDYAASTTSRKSRHSQGGGGHRATQSFSEPPVYLQPAVASDARSTRSHHSRSASSPYDAKRSGAPATPSKPASVRSYAAQNPMASTSQLQVQQDPNKSVQRSPSRTSMHSHYDPETYLDPAFYGAEGHNSRSQSPGLEYV